MTKNRFLCAAVAAWLGWCAAASTTAAQDLEPKAYTASPVGGAFVVVGLDRSTGGIVFDPTVPITDAEAKINRTISVGWQWLWLTKR
jgi:hypothetical protein